MCTCVSVHFESIQGHSHHSQMDPVHHVLSPHESLRSRRSEEGNERTARIPFLNPDWHRRHPKTCLKFGCICVSLCVSVCVLVLLFKDHCNELTLTTGTFLDGQTSSEDMIKTCFLGGLRLQEFSLGLGG